MFEKIIEYLQMWNIQIGISKIIIRVNIFVNVKTFRFLRNAYLQFLAKMCFRFSIVIIIIIIFKGKFILKIISYQLVNGKIIHRKTKVCLRFGLFYEVKLKLFSVSYVNKRGSTNF